MRHPIPYAAVESGARALADWLKVDFDRIGEGQTTLRRQADAVLNGAAPFMAVADTSTAEGFLRWLVRMDDPQDEQGCKDRQVVRLSQIIEKARALLGEAS